MHLLNDSHLITPNEYLKTECEICQNENDIRELHEVRFVKSFKVVCSDCKKKLEEDEVEN